MSLKNRMIIILVVLIGILSLFGWYSRQSFTSMNHLAEAHHQALVLNNLIIELEMAQTTYHTSMERYVATKVSDYLTSIEILAQAFSKDYYSSQTALYFEQLNTSLREYNHTFQLLVSEQNQVAALLQEMDTQISDLSELSATLPYDELAYIDNLAEFPASLFGFSTKLQRLNRTDAIFSFDFDVYYLSLSELLTDIQEHPDSAKKVKIIAYRINNKIEGINTTTQKLISQKLQLRETNDALHLVVEDIKNNISYIISTQSEELATERKRVLFLINVALFIVIGLFIGMILHILRFITLNLNFIIETTKQLTDGDYSIRLKTIDDNEFGYLSLAINQMAESLEQSFATQKEISDHLEEIVEQRTKELSDAKRNLEIANQQISDEKEKLAKIAITDELTGLYNRRAAFKFLEEQISFSLRYNHPLTIMIIDLDQFKNINDRYGHIMGDEVLKKLSHIFIQTIRDIDYVSRFGGEEFLFIFPETSIINIRVIINRLQSEVRKAQFTNSELHVTFSGGIASLTNETSIELIHKADQRLYLAKNNGRDMVFYTDDLPSATDTAD